VGLLTLLQFVLVTVISLDFTTDPHTSCRLFLSDTLSAGMPSFVSDT